MCSYSGSTGGGIFASYDGGMNWINISDGLPNRSTYSLTIDQTNGDTLYTGLANSPYGVWTYTEVPAEIKPEFWQLYQ